jgi:hypothetical protein
MSAEQAVEITTEMIMDFLGMVRFDTIEKFLQEKFGEEFVTRYRELYMSNLIEAAARHPQMASIVEEIVKENSAQQEPAPAQ